MLSCSSVENAIEDRPDRFLDNCKRRPDVVLSFSITGFSLIELNAVTDADDLLPFNLRPMSPRF